MRDPFAHDANAARDRRLAGDGGLLTTARRLWWLGLATAIVALVLVAAIWIVWRWM